MDLPGIMHPQMKYYLDLWEDSKMVDPVAFPFIDQNSVCWLPDEYLRKMNNILETMLEYRPFEVVTIHDDFRVHPNNVNALRKHYRNILMDLAEADVLGHIMRMLYQNPGIKHTKKTNNLSTLIAGSNYGLC